MDPFQNIEVEEQPMDCAFHPQQIDFLAIGCVDGMLRGVSCSAEDSSVVLLAKAHKLSCRAVAFANASIVLAGSEDGSVLACSVHEEQPLNRFTDAQGGPVTRLQGLDEKAFVSGDEAGTIKVWDLRQKKSVHDYNHHSDYVSDLGIHPAQPYLVATSGDGTLSVLDRRKNKVIGQSAGDPDDGMESLAVVKGGRRVVCGSMTGMLNIFSWGKFENGDKYPGHPTSVGAMVKLDEDTVATACDDGILRVLSIQPNKLLGVLGEDPDGECGRLALSPDGKRLASTSCGTAVRIWNLDADVEDEAPGEGRSPARQRESEGGSSSSDEKAERQKKPAKKQRKKGRATAGPSQGKADFFKDLL